MSSNSPLDLLLSLVSGMFRSPALNILPSLFFNLAVLWFGIVGWKRHRVRGFLLWLAAAVLGLVSNITFMSVFVGDHYMSSPQVLALAIGRQLGTIGTIFFAAGVWHFVYRTRFGPPEPPEQ